MKWRRGHQRWECCCSLLVLEWCQWWSPPYKCFRLFGHPRSNCCSEAPNRCRPSQLIDQHTSRHWLELDQQKWIP
jgi:hypothetical protein